VRVDEGWADYAPEYARCVSENHDIELERVSKNKRNATYSILSRNEGGFSEGQKINLTPWYLKASEHDWYAPGSLETDRPIPKNGRVWSIQSKGQEVGMSDRWADLLGAPHREDSVDYLSVLRGFQYSRLTESTPKHTERACELILDLPYAREGGSLIHQERINDDQGNPKYDQVSIGGVTHRIDPYWKNSELLKKDGTDLDPMESMVEGVSVWDWFNAAKKIADLVDTWEQWGRFVVSVPGKVGLSIQSYDDINQLLDQSGHRDHPYNIDQISKRDIEPDVQGKSGPEQSSYQICDMISDAGGTVVNNDPPNIEDPSNPSDTLSMRRLDEMLSLDGGVLNRPRPRVIDVNQCTMGGIDQAVKSPYFDLREPSIDISRPLTSAEQSANLSRASLRMVNQNQYVDGQNQDQPPGFPRPYTLLWLYEGSTDTLASYTKPSFDQFNDSGSTTNYDVEMYGGPHRLTVVGGNGSDVYFSQDYGETALIAATPISARLTCIDNNWIGAKGGNILRPTASNQWNDALSLPSSYDVEGISFPEDTKGYAIGNSGGDCYIYATDDNGANWSENQIGNAGYDLDSDSFGVAWVATGTGILKWDHQSVTNHLPNESFNAVHVVNSSTVWACGPGNTLYRTKDGGANWSSISLSTSDDLNDIDFYRNQLGMIVTGSGQAWLTEDGGGSWDEHTWSGHTSYTFEGCHQGPRWFRALVGANGGMLRWR